MLNSDELIEVAEICSDYHGEPMMSSLDNIEISCESCSNWDGEKCSINVYDKVLSYLD